MQTDLQLCDPETGMVDGTWLDQHNRLARAAGHEPTGRPFPCTGSACYVFGQHIRCTSEFHKKPVATPITLTAGVSLSSTVLSSGGERVNAERRVLSPEDVSSLLEKES